MKNIYLTACLACVSFHSVAQANRWQWGIGTNLHFTNYDMQAPAIASSEPMLRYGLAALGRYRLRRSANFQWGPWRNRLKLFLETGLQADALGYAYQIGESPVLHQFLSFQAPLNLVLTTEVRNFITGKRKPQLEGYARLGGGIGVTAPQKVDAPAGYFQETRELIPLRFFLHLGGGLAKIRTDGGRASVGVFTRYSLLPLAEGKLTSPSANEPLLFRIGGSLVGLECHYFFGKRKKPTARQAEEPVQMILCPKF